MRHIPAAVTRQASNGLRAPTRAACVRLYPAGGRALFLGYLNTPKRRRRGVCYTRANYVLVPGSRAFRYLKLVLVAQLHYKR